MVDIDLEKFFDRVNHDILMSLVRRKVKDRRVLKLIDSYLKAGMFEGGIISPRQEGTPQGGPLSPLLSNILLDELDKELEKRGHAFCRYADDCNIYVATKASGERVMASITQFPVGTAQAHGQPSQKRGRPTVAQNISWVHHVLASDESPPESGG